MRIYTYSLQTFGSRRIFIGKQGENAATRIDIDVTPWRTGYPDSVIALYVKPPSGNGYLAALGDDGKTVRWTVLDTDTAYAGIGSAELVLQNAEGTVIKSVTADTSCLESLSAEEPSEPPEAIRPWVEQILDAIANAGVGGGEESGGGAPGVGIARIEQTVVSDEDGGANIWTATLTDGSTYSLEVRNGQRGATGPQGHAGADGKDGAPGEDGGYYTPAVDSDGNLTWTASKAGMPTITGANIKGPAGEGTGVEVDNTLTQSGKAADAKVVGDKLTELNEAKADKAGWTAGKNLVTDADGNVATEDKPEALKNPNKLILYGAVKAEYDGSEPVSVEIPEAGAGGIYPVVSMTAETAELLPNTFYRWGETAALSITLATPTNEAITNEYCFEFVSGSTATTLTVPDTIRWAQEPSIEAGKTYQVSILNGIGVICGA